MYYTAVMVGSRHVTRKDAATVGSMEQGKRYHLEVTDVQGNEDAMVLLSPVYMIAGVGLRVAKPAVLLMTIPVAGLKPSRNVVSPYPARFRP